MTLNRRWFAIAAGSTVLLPYASRAADSVSGRYVGGGKEARLAFVSAYARDGLSSKDGVMIVMTERDHSASKRPDFDADFGKFGSALTISLNRPEGNVFGCQVAHQGLKRSPVSVLGSVKAADVSFANERIKARFTTNGPSKFFDETFEVDIQVDSAIRPKPA